MRRLGSAHGTEANLAPAASGAFGALSMPAAPEARWSEIRSDCRRDPRPGSSIASLERPRHALALRRHAGLAFALAGRSTTGRQAKPPKAPSEDARRIPEWAWRALPTASSFSFHCLVSCAGRGISRDQWDA